MRNMMFVMTAVLAVAHSGGFTLEAADDGGPHERQSKKVRHACQGPKCGPYAPSFGEWRISLAEGIGKAGANATSVEISKALNYFRLTVATVNDPIVAATNAYNLNIVARVNNRFPIGTSSSPPF